MVKNQIYNYKIKIKNQNKIKIEWLPDPMRSLASNFVALNLTLYAGARTAKGDWKNSNGWQSPTLRPPPLNKTKKKTKKEKKETVLIKIRGRKFSIWSGD